MMRHYILDDCGEPVPCDDLLDWARWYEDATRSGLRVVAQTPVGELWVSTVFLALDHAFGAGPPILWETMTFGTTPLGPRETVVGQHARYTSREDAVIGHARAVAVAQRIVQEAEASKQRGEV